MNFPAASVAGLPSPPVVCLAASMGGIGRILHVDDDPVARPVLGAWLECKGYAVTQAGGSVEAERRLAESAFDVIISDIHMPGNERLQWVEQVLRRPGAPAVVLLTGNPEFETACCAANLPVAGYLVKPPDFARIDDLLRRIVAEQRRRVERLAVADELLALLEAHGADELAGERALAERLAGLAHELTAREARAEETMCDGLTRDETWRAVIRETITVIEKTKDSFRSKELGRLRARLQHVLAEPAPRGARIAEKNRQVAARCDETGIALRCAPCATA